MPHYYFHIRDNDRLISDEEGMDLPGDAYAVSEARQCAMDMIADAALASDDISHQVIEVTDSGHRVVERIAMIRLDDPAT